MHRHQHRRTHFTRQRRHHGIQCVVCDAVLIDAADCAAMLKYPKLTPEQRLMVALGTGLSAASFASLKRKAARAIADAGSIDAAIKKLTRARARSHKEITNER
jgi:hypothetical protein